MEDHHAFPFNYSEIFIFSNQFKLVELRQPYRLSRRQCFSRGDPYIHGIYLAVEFAPLQPPQFPPQVRVTRSSDDQTVAQVHVQTTSPTGTWSRNEHTCMHHTITRISAVKSFCD